MKSLIIAVWPVRPWQAFVGIMLCNLLTLAWNERTSGHRGVFALVMLSMVLAMCGWARERLRRQPDERSE